ncbi:MAG: hypothetical protein LBJ21_02650 [Acidobacteriota bacterium]|jgi:hypothetical protein|nr:hypothetical protein [Acidobacteriota bacterium]
MTSKKTLAGSAKRRTKKKASGSGLRTSGRKSDAQTIARLEATIAEMSAAIADLSHGIHHIGHKGTHHEGHEEPRSDCVFCQVFFWVESAKS